MIEKRDFRRRKLPEKYMVKMLYEQNNRKFEEKYLEKLEKNNKNESQSLWRRNLGGRITLEL